jgi:hypothetical protein
MQVLGRTAFVLALGLGFAWIGGAGPGFAQSPPPPADPPSLVISQGALQLNQAYDLEGRAVGQGRSGVNQIPQTPFDVWFEERFGPPPPAAGPRKGPPPPAGQLANPRGLNAVAGASVVVAGGVRPNRAACDALLATGARFVAVEQAALNTHYCVRTTQGRIAWMKITSIAPRPGDPAPGGGRWPAGTRSNQIAFDFALLP